MDESSSLVVLHIFFPAQAKLASFACFDVEQSELRVFDSKVDRAASEATRQGWPEWHSRTWGFGFCYVYTRALALDCAEIKHWFGGQTSNLSSSVKSKSIRLIFWTGPFLSSSSPRRVQKFVSKRSH